MSGTFKRKVRAGLEGLQHELVDAQRWLAGTGRRLVQVVFEGRDAAGKNAT